MLAVVRISDVMSTDAIFEEAVLCVEIRINMEVMSLYKCGDVEWRGAGNIEVWKR